MRDNSRSLVRAHLASNASDADFLTVENARSWSLLTYFGADVISGKAAIASEILELMQHSPKDSPSEDSLRSIVLCATASVRRRRPMGSNQGASMAVACRDTGNSAHLTRLRVACIGDCRAWHMGQGAPKEIKPDVRAYLGAYDIDFDQLLSSRTTAWCDIDEAAGEYLLLAPAGYVPKARSVWTGMVTSSVVVLLAALLFVVIRMALIDRPAPPPTAQILMPTVTQTKVSPQTPIPPTLPPKPAVEPASPAPGAAATREVAGVPKSAEETAEETGVVPDSAGDRTDGDAAQVALVSAVETITTTATSTVTQATQLVLNGVSAQISEGELRFTWIPAAGLPPGQSLEVVIWQPNESTPQQEPDCFLAVKCGLTLQTANVTPPSPDTGELFAQFNRDNPGYLVEGQEYFWTVFVVAMDQNSEPQTSTKRIAEATLSMTGAVSGEYPSFIFKIEKEKVDAECKPDQNC